MKVIQRLFQRYTMIEYYVYLSNKIGEYCIVFVEKYIIFLKRFAINCEASYMKAIRKRWMIEPYQKKVMSGYVRKHSVEVTQLSFVQKENIDKFRSKDCDFKTFLHEFDINGVRFFIQFYCLRVTMRIIALNK